MTKGSFRLVRARPVFLIPIFLCWFAVSGIILYLQYYWSPADYLPLFLEFFVALFLITYAVCMSNIIMLELIQPMEDGQERTLTQSLYEAFSRDSLKVIPIALLWALVWFILIMIQVIISLLKGKGASENHEPSLRDAAITLGGLKGEPFSWVGLGFRMMEKLIRLVSFLALPGIAWKNFGPSESLREGLSVIRQKPLQFLTVYTLTSAASLVMALPLLPIAIAVELELPISDVVWTCVLIYEAVVWTFSIYLEQMTMGLLYLKNQDQTLFTGNLDTEVNAYMAHVHARVLATQDIRPPYEVLVQDGLDQREKNDIRASARKSSGSR